MSKDVVVVDGFIEKVIPNSKFIILLTNKMRIEGHLSGKMRIHYIKIMTGDYVKVEISPYDPSKGRIIYRSIPTPILKEKFKKLQESD
ncbi:translation initiation factor IF-1 [Mycoplasma sp. SG1]|uniref:translation initiation factor IF-1 n=1 Tax=Mycoplasma sp. SG1 TaxID=2810348 RepID=UPI002024E481|nr:translation initiation factor IF-1 [Mycoplasma sp. SG1]URM52912.1 translation initiation factor IF-1 [Mycoplasma sp. SG1]